MNTKRHLLILLLASILLAQGLATQTTKEIPTQDPDKVDIDPELESKFQQDTDRLFSTQKTETVEIIVDLGSYRRGVSDISNMKELNEEDLQSLEALAEQDPDLELKNTFWISNSALIEAPNNIDLEKIAKVDGVNRLNTNFEVETLSGSETISSSSSGTQETNGDTTYGLEQINASKTWNEFDTAGEDTKVAVLDTGLNESHPDIDLFTRDPEDPTFPGGWAEFDEDGDEVEGSEPSDPDGHGTHVSGTVIGEDTFTNPEFGENVNIGVAPNATLIHGAVLTQCGFFGCGGDFAQIKGGMEWAIEEDADILSMSLGGNSLDDDFIEPVRNAENNGTMVVAAIGNDEEGNSGSPGNTFDSLSVGASNEDKEIAEFSGGELIEKDDWDDAPDDWDETYITPRLSAPGVDVLSATIDEDSDEDVWTLLDGTSMATPHVSGAAALLQSATDTNLGPNDIEKALVESAWKPSDWNEEDAESDINGQDTRYGHGIIDAYEATSYAVNEFDSPENLELLEDSFEASNNEQSILVEVQNSQGSVIQDDGFTVQVVSDSDNLGISGPKDTNSDGVAEFTFSETNSDTYELELELESDTSVDTVSSVEIQPSNPNSLSGTNVEAEAGKKDSIILDVEDEFKNPIENEKIALNNSDSLSGLPDDNITDNNGQVTFDFVEEEKGVYEPEFNVDSDKDIVETVDVDVEASDVSKLDFANQPNSTVEAGETILDEEGESILVEALDDFGNINEDFNDNVAVSKLDGGELGDESAEDGVADFANLEISEVGSYNLSASTDGSIDSVVSNGFEVMAGPAADLANTDIDEELVAGEEFSTSVEVQDSEGNPVEGIGVEASLDGDSFSSGDTQNISNSDGEAVFTNLTINTADKGYEIEFSIDGEDEDVESSTGKNTETFSVDASSPDSLETDSIIGNGTAVDESGIDVELFLADEFGNPVESEDVLENSPENLTLDGSSTVSTDTDGLASFNFDSEDVGNFTVSFTNNGLDVEEVLEFSPGEPDGVKFSSLGDKRVGEDFKVNLTVVDEFSNQVTGFEDILDLELQNTEHEDTGLNESTTEPLESGKLLDKPIKIDSTTTEDDIDLEASGGESSFTDSSESFNLDKPTKPELKLDTNQTLLLENETVGIEFNESFYSFDDNDISRELELLDNVGQKLESLSIEKSDSSDKSSDYTFDKLESFEGELSFKVNLSLKDVFDQETFISQNITIREPRNFSTSVEGSVPDISIEESSGKNRVSNSSSINTRVPQSSNWTVKISEEEKTTSLDNVNVTEDVKANITYQADNFNPNVDLFDEEATIAANTSLNFTEASNTVEGEDLDSLYRCGDWDFDSQSCSGDWSDVTQDAEFTSENASINVDGFSAYSFGTEEEEETEDDNGDNGGTSGGSSSSSSGGGFSSSPSQDLPIEPEIETIDDSEGFTITNLEDAENETFEVSEKPSLLSSIDVNFANTTSSSSINITKEPVSDLENELLFYNGFRVETTDVEIESSELEFRVNRSWINQTRGDARDINIYRKASDNWDNFQTSLIDQRENYYVYNSDLDGFSSFAVGISDPCPVVEVAGVDPEQEMCAVFESYCDLPENYTEVDSCSEWREEQRIQEKIEELGETSSREAEETLEEAKKALEQGEFDRAENLTLEAEKAEEQNSLLASVSSITQRSTDKLVTGLLILIIATIGTLGVIKTFRTSDRVRTRNRENHNKMQTQPNPKEKDENKEIEKQMIEITDKIKKHGNVESETVELLEQADRARKNKNYQEAQNKIRQIRNKLRYL